MPKQPKQIEERSPEELPALAISPDKVCFVIIKPANSTSKTS